jgi:cell division control protein 7
VILLSFLSKRFPFFNSSDDIDAMIELTTIFGRAQMAGCAKLHSEMLLRTWLMVDCTFEINLPSVSDRRMTFWRLIRWCHGDSLFQGPLNREETLALEFLDQCMELNPNLRFSAEGALNDPFLKDAEEDQLLDDEVAFT